MIISFSASQLFHSSVLLMTSLVSLIVSFLSKFIFYYLAQKSELWPPQCKCNLKKWICVQKEGDRDSKTGSSETPYPGHPTQNISRFASSNIPHTHTQPKVNSLKVIKYPQNQFVYWIPNKWKKYFKVSAYWGAFHRDCAQDRVIYLQVCVINTGTLKTEKIFYSKYLFKQYQTI